MKIQILLGVMPVENDRLLDHWTREVDWPAVPRVGDMIDLADGWCVEKVTSVIWSSGGEAQVRLYARLTHDEEAALRATPEWASA